MGVTALSIVPQLLLTGSAIGPWLPLVILPVQAYFFYVIISWFTQNVHPSSGTALSFHRSWFALIGWWLLSLLSVFTIIGWAWVYSAMGRWYGQNIQSGGN